ncbi:hypothetical protein [Mycoplasma bradburyae]|uniref:hypothetical protein n=1 Tax=Mycoplasma bradburyae TaxID=2963128 RepID=UPI0020CE2EB4|nr:hypothetical protein [Mycoplasma bradburyae]UTS70570.1 hypothetical protein NMG77_02335 [Mycoplasma bradburyae]
MKINFLTKDYDHVVNNLVNKLKEWNFNLSKTQEDGRVNSIINEKEIIDVILNRYSEIEIFNKLNLIIEKQPKERFWYDILIKNNDKSFYCPINIKVTDLNKKSADNISSKEGLYFSLTGEESTTLHNQYKSFFESLNKEMKQTESDYFFIIFNKNDKEDIFYNSLRRLNSLVPNGNNLPFQCKWIENKTIINRSFEQAKNFLLSNFFESIKRRSQILSEFESVFGSSIE